MAWRALKQKWSPLCTLLVWNIFEPVRLLDEEVGKTDKGECWVNDIGFQQGMPLSH